MRATESLIYAGGINATGMDLIVKTSGVARKRIYKHYDTKEVLVAAALSARDERWMHWFIEATTRAPSPRDRVLSIFDALREWFASEGFRGCAFIINDLPIEEADRNFHWPLGRRPDDHPSLSDLGM